jgi:hypothetical protein
VTVVMVVMVFALQHTQARQQAVTQRKLDELLRAQPTADDRLIALEGASDEELAALTDLSHAYRERVLVAMRKCPPAATREPVYGQELVAASGQGAPLRSAGRSRLHRR